MKRKPSIEDLVGIGHTKLGFFKEVQVKIAELQKSYRDLERERQQVQAILDGITDMVAVITPSYRIRSVNHSFFDVFPHPNPTDQKCHEIFRGRRSPCESCALREALDTNQVCRQSAIFQVGGTNRQFEITASPLRNSAGAPTDILVVKRDVTLEKKFQAEYYHTEKMATIGLLAAGVAHEINNPLTSIQGFTEGLQRRMSDLEKRAEDPRLTDVFHEYLGIIRRECRRCSDIVQSLLTFSPRKKAELSRVNLTLLVNNVMKILQHKLKHLPEHQVRLHLDPMLPEIQGIPEEIEQVILNLFLNALDAVEEAGVVSIRTRAMADDPWVYLEVRDDGCGISEEHMAKLFEPFFTTKPVGKGIGIGLSTCYHIIQAHGGEITVDSSQGHGALFTVRFPSTAGGGRGR
jgi:signal transduction histidine kinase